MTKNKFIIVVGSISYGDPFLSFGRVTNRVKLLFKKPDRVKAVLFTGGEDVDPSLYGGKKSSLSYTSLKRDLYEREIFLFCKKHNIKQISICRGLQFLGVMTGSKMYQHVENHAGVYHKIVYPALEESHYVNSLHHQMMDISKDAIPIAWTVPNLCNWAINADGVISNPPKREIEAAVFPKDNAMGVQFHPEMMKEEEKGRIFYIKMIKDFFENDIGVFTDLYGAKKFYNDLPTS